MYIGTWASSIEFGNDASAEIDLYAGYRGGIDNFTSDVGFLYYLCPSTSAAGLDFWKIYRKAGYNFGPAAVTLSVTYTPDNTGAVSNDQGVYYSGVASAPLGDMFTISAASATRRSRAHRTAPIGMPERPLTFRAGSASTPATTAPITKPC